jgi:hypothetical protein
MKHICVYIYIYLYINKYIYVHIYTSIDIHIYMYTYRKLFLFIYICKFIYIYRLKQALLSSPLTTAIELLGCMPKNIGVTIEERHLGLEVPVDSKVEGSKRLVHIYIYIYI